MPAIYTIPVFDRWFERLRDRRAAARIQARIDRAESGNLGDSRPVGEGVSEMRVDYGPGYRVYYVQRGPEVVILLVGGGKATQARDIELAKRLARQVSGVHMAGKVKLRKWDSARHLKTEADIARYWEACLEEGRDDPAFITTALGNIARARGMSQLARKTGLTREGLYKALSPSGNPEFGTVMKVIRALGLELRGATAMG